MATELTVAEQRTWTACRQDIAKGREHIETGWILIGQSLIASRDGKLYRKDFETFEAFCEAEGISRRSAYRWMGTLENVPRAAQIGFSLRALEELGGLDESEQAAVVEEVASTPGPPTAEKVRKVRAAKGMKPKASKPKEPPPVQQPDIIAIPDEEVRGSCEMVVGDGKPDGAARARVIMGIRTACKEADQWTDEECREEVADELEKQWKRFRVVTAKAPKANGRFKPPTQEEVTAYIAGSRYAAHVDPIEFWNFYDSNGWKVGENGMKNWRAAVTTWRQRAIKKSGQKPPGAVAVPAGKYDFIDEACR